MYLLGTVAHITKVQYNIDIQQYISNTHSKKRCKKKQKKLFIEKIYLCAPVHSIHYTQFVQQWMYEYQQQQRLKMKREKKNKWNNENKTRI